MKKLNGIWRQARAVSIEVQGKGNIIYICMIRCHSVPCYEYSFIILYYNQSMKLLWKEVMSSLSSSRPGDTKGLHSCA